MQHILYSERLQLIPFLPEDSVLFLNLNTNPFVRQFLWDDQIIDATTAEAIIQQNSKHFQEDRYGLWKLLIEGSNEVIGYTGLWYFFDEPQPQLIYALLEPYTQKGYATEAATRVISYAFAELNFQYLLAAMDEPHRASQKVAKRLGMTLLDKRIEEGKSTVFYRINKR
ncbi:MAG: GNAT family N-acetyltransferase [Bacteroidota bacterium]